MMFAVDSYRTPKELLPLELYRIEYPDNATTYSPTQGFAAADTTKAYRENDEEEFKRDIVKQFTWGCRDRLPFINLFSDREHAENWALKEPWRGGEVRVGDWKLHVIDTAAMGEAQLFRLGDLVENLGLRIPEVAEQHIRHAYLCLHKIPAAAIVSTRNPKQVKDDRYFRRFRWEPEYHPYEDYLEGCSSSEAEMLQENWNTIFEKNMENAW